MSKPSMEFKELLKYFIDNANQAMPGKDTVNGNPGMWLELGGRFWRIHIAGYCINIYNGPKKDSMLLATVTDGRGLIFRNEYRYLEPYKDCFKPIKIYTGPCRIVLTEY